MADGSAPIATQPASPARRSTPSEVWDEVREDYLSGLSASQCCRRHDVGLSALRYRARREGWRRADQDWTAPANALEPWDEGLELEQRVGGDLDKVELCQLAFVATRRFMRAILRGDAAEALRWRRVRLAVDAEEAEMERHIAQEEALRLHRRDWAEYDAAVEADRLAAQGLHRAQDEAADPADVHRAHQFFDAEELDDPLDLTEDFQDLDPDDVHCAHQDEAEGDYPSPLAGEGGSRSETDEGLRRNTLPTGPRPAGFPSAPASGPPGPHLPPGATPPGAASPSAPERSSLASWPSPDSPPAGP